MNTIDSDGSPAPGGRKGPAYISFFPDRWFGGTRRMSPAEKGAYIDLLMEQAAQGSIPAAPRQLARIVGMPLTEFEEAWRAVLHEKFEPHPDDPGRLVNRRMAHERDRAVAFGELQRQKGLKGGRPRKAGGKPGVSPGKATQTQTHTHTETQNLDPPRIARARAWEGPLEELRLPLDLHARLDRLAGEWAAYRREAKHKAYTARTWKSQLAAAARDPDAWEAAINHSIAKGYQGIVEPNGKKPRRDTLTELGDELRRRGLTQ